MKNGSKWVSLALCLLLVLAAPCALASEASYKIGILEYVEHPALDAAVEGFLVALKDQGIEDGKNLTVTLLNPSADNATAQLMAGQLVQDGNNLLLGVATNAVQALAAQTDSMPILGTAVTDYVSAGLVASNEEPGINVSGTTDMNPIDLQIDLLIKLVPEAKTIGICYTSNEVNSQIQADIAKAEAEKRGLAVVVKTVTTVGDVQQAVQSLVGQIDALYVPTDNVLASSMAVVTQVTDAAMIPVIVGEENMCKSGALATVGLNYYQLGYQTGMMAFRVLTEGADPAEMPIEAQSDAKISVNLKSAELLDIAIPQDMLDSANKFE